MKASRKVLDLLNDNDMTRKDLAREIGVSYPIVVNMIKHDDFSDRTLRLVSEYFEVPISYFDSNETESKSDDDSEHEKYMAKLDDLIETKDKYIKLLEETNEMLRKQLEESKA